MEINTASQLPGSRLLLQRDHARELSTSRFELRRRTLLGDHAVFKHDDLVGILDGTHAVRDYDDGLSRKQTRERLLHHGLVLDVQARRCLIQKDDGRVLEESLEPFSPIIVS